LGLATFNKSCFALILCVALGFVPFVVSLCCSSVLLVLWVHRVIGVVGSSHYEYCKYVVLLLVLVVHQVVFVTLGLSHCWFVMLFLLLFLLCVTFIAKGSSGYVYSCWFIMLLLLLLVRHITYFVVGLVINLLHCWSHYIASHVVVGSLHSWSCC